MPADVPTHKAVRLEHRGGMQFDAEPSSGHPYDFDDRQSNTGGSPVETVLVGLAGVLGDGRGLDPGEEAAGRLALHDRGDAATSATSTRRSSAEITVVHELEGSNLSEAAIRRAIELSATKYCPVNAMVSAGATEVHHRYRVRSVGAHAYESEGEVLATGPYRRGGRDCVVGCFGVGGASLATTVVRHARRCMDDPPCSPTGCMLDYRTRSRQRLR